MPLPDNKQISTQATPVTINEVTQFLFVLPQSLIGFDRAAVIGSMLGGN